MGWESLKDYNPANDSDDFGIIKSNNLVCQVQYVRIEDYKGQKQELVGVPFLKYELTVTGGDDQFAGRKLWGSFNLQNDDKLKKLKKLFFVALGVEINSQDDLENNLEAFANGTYSVKAWGWKPDGKDEAIQQHQIKGVATVETNDSVSF